MAEYENRPVREGINVSDEHPLKEFFTLLLAAALILVIAAAALSLAAGQLAKHIPFAWEQPIADSAMAGLPTSPPTAEQQRVQQYLQALADDLATAQGLPPGMRVTVHYSEADVVNAYATLGGHIMMFRGLLQALPSENAVAAVLAHEIAHINHRDPIVAAGRGLTVVLALASLSGIGNVDSLDWLLNQLGAVTVLGFNRAQERAADYAALETLRRHYGHLADADVVFRYFEELESNAGVEPPLLLRSHPLSEERVAGVQAYMARYPSLGVAKELPAAASESIQNQESGE